MNSTEHRRTVAIACQGGGSHTAFTAGVLDGLLEAGADDDGVEFEVVELTGTSGGAICAFVTWFGLASVPENGPERARRLLARVWDDIAAADPADALVNAVGVGAVRAQSMGVPAPGVSPYDSPASEWGRGVLRSVLEDAVPPEDLDAVVGRTDPPVPRLEIGAVDVQRGSFKTFTERDVSHDAVLASAAVPPLFRAAPVTGPDGTTRYYWDGLFSQNPPLGDVFRTGEGRAEGADELWVVQINPRRDDDLPRTLEAIGDRRNELGGNLSVNQELRVIRQLNQWAAEGHLDEVYDPFDVKTIDLDERAVSPGRTLDYATKLDRSPKFLARLWDHGRDRAERFLAVERDRRRVREAVTETWAGAPETVPEDWFVETFEARLPSALTELAAYLGGRPEVDRTDLTREEYVDFARSVRAPVSDLEFDIEETVAERGAVAVRWRGTGTHTETILGVDPTGEELTLSGVSIYHLDDGRLTGSWVLTEGWSLLRQLDAVDPEVPLGTTDRVTATPIVTQLSAPAENEGLARAEVEAVWNAGRREVLDRVFADDCVLHLDDETDLRGREAYWAFVRRYREAFPDLDLTIEETVSEGDKLVMRATLRGTHEGPFLTVDPTGERVEVSRMVVHHVDDGRVTETGIVEDTVRLLHQLGVGPDAVTG